MSKTRDNHYVPQWHQKGFMEEREQQLCHLTRREINIPGGETKLVESKKWQTPTQRFYEVDLYSTFFGSEINDDIERQLFGPIDNNGSTSIRAFLGDDQAQWHNSFLDLFTYIDSQKLRTPKGLDWIKSKYSELNQSQLMMEMQSLRTMHCTLWAEGVRELVSASESETKFILSDHPVTVYNYACPPDSELCVYPNDPDITLKGSQTIFPLDKNRCLILTNLEYAQDPKNTNPIQQRINATRQRNSMVNTINFINSRKLTDDEVKKINYIIKSRSNKSIAAGREDWLYPEKDIKNDWAELRHVLLPSLNGVMGFGGEMYVKFEDGSVHYQDAFGRTSSAHEFLRKKTSKARIGRNSICGCGSGRKYKYCCLNLAENLRTSWDVLSIRERNLAFCTCIKDVLGLNKGKTWSDVRRNLSEDDIIKIYEFYSVLWPADTDIYALLPKSDGKLRGLYSGPVDIRTITENAVPMASLFDEFLIETPIFNPNIINPEFSPIKSPSQYKYQSLKDFLFFLQMEPFIGLGLINIIPEPVEFDTELMRAMLGMVRDRGQRNEPIHKQDLQRHFILSTQDLLNSTALMPRDMRVNFLVSQFGLNEMSASEIITTSELNAASSPLTLLQKTSVGSGGQLMMSRNGPNYEMALFIAQVTGSVIVTDSISRWEQLYSAQHRVQGISSFPWGNALDAFNIVPLDLQFEDTFKKSQGPFSKARNLLKEVDQTILSNNRTQAHIQLLTTNIIDLIKQLNADNKSLVLKNMMISSPEGGFYDRNVQRLLARSSCLKYDDNVRSILGIDIATM
ncbi:Uncharacterised protein [Escherichia coli]|uniref:DUF4238 domain-containing protein n=1 Tax=Escherichia coli TaxID=562 RepID=UPI00191889AF|nr:DUF4238 domain-containing protein [Escherichia coli]CAD5509568.1 Uncharacterised protein [Escherichia coli]HAZ4787945.1 DUF4238 domain-containing protein [Citrobacter amalonaticus]